MADELMACRTRQPCDVHGGRGMLEQRSMAYLHDVVQVGGIRSCARVGLVKGLVTGSAREFDEGFAVRRRVISTPLRSLGRMKLGSGNEMDL